MKKKITVFIALILAIFVLASCSGNAEFNFSGAYWNEDPTGTGVTAIDETIEYSATSVFSGEFSGKELKSEGLELVTDQASSYVTHLKNDGGEYVYTTTLKLKGKYVYNGGKEYSFDFDDYTTEIETRFKGLDSNLSPIKTITRARNVLPLALEPKEEDDFTTFGFTATIEYGEKAILTVEPDEDSKNRFPTETTVEIAKYSSGAFLDDNLLIFAFRAMNFGSSFSKNFNTIDIMARSLKEVSCVNVSAINGTETEEKVTPVDVSPYVENGAPSNGKKSFDTYGVCFKTTGTYAKAFRYVYYAVNPKDENGRETSANVTRHRPVLIYAPQIFNTGYFRFAIKSVTDK